MSDNTPTDDEREAMARAVHAAIPGTGEWESDPDHNYIWFEFGDRVLAAGFRRSEPQGEPSDAQVLSAFNAFFGLEVDYISEGKSTRMRAALRADGVAK